MLITIKKLWILKLFGWKTFPSYVTANHKLWRFWFLNNISRNGVWEMTRRKLIGFFLLGTNLIFGIIGIIFVFTSGAPFYFGTLALISGLTACFVAYELRKLYE